jgi:methylated-DNA-protein-cysteine methyltransferase-like protein
VSYRQIYEVVKRIPPGRVATYGQVATLAGLPGHARQVGYALHALPESSTVPWHRVVNANGGISARAVPGAELVQRRLLLEEGVRLNSKGQVSLAQVRWSPTGKAKRPA